MIKILDCTTRDGGHTTNWNFEDEFVVNLMKTLNKSGISYYEIGYRNHYDNEGKGRFYKCNPEFLEQFYKHKGNLELGVMTDTKRFAIEDFPGSENDHLDFIRIACHPDQIKETLKIAKNLHNKGYKIFVQLMDVSNIKEDGFITLFEWQNKDILESLYFADSYGTITPEDVENFYYKFKILGYEKISFHGHNNINLALPNSLKALKLGAYSIDVTQNGIGRCGGNLASEELFSVL